jgi:hypothetical protein
MSGVLNGEPYAETGRELYDGKGAITLVPTALARRAIPITRCSP